MSASTRKQSRKDTRRVAGSVPHPSIRRWFQRHNPQPTCEPLPNVFHLPVHGRDLPPVSKESKEAKAGGRSLRPNQAGKDLGVEVFHWNVSPQLYCAVVPVATVTIVRVASIWDTSHSEPRKVRPKSSLLASSDSIYQNLCNVRDTLFLTFLLSPWQLLVHSRPSRFRSICLFQLS